MHCFRPPRGPRGTGKRCRWPWHFSEGLARWPWKAVALSRETERLPGVKVTAFKPGGGQGTAFLTAPFSGYSSAHTPPMAPHCLAEPV